MAIRTMVLYKHNASKFIDVITHFESEVHWYAGFKSNMGLLSRSNTWNEVVEQYYW